MAVLYSIVYLEREAARLAGREGGNEVGREEM